MNPKKKYYALLDAVSDAIERPPGKGDAQAMRALLREDLRRAAQAHIPANDKGDDFVEMCRVLNYVVRQAVDTLGDDNLGDEYAIELARLNLTATINFLARAYGKAALPVKRIG